MSSDNGSRPSLTPEEREAAARALAAAAAKIEQDVMFAGSAAGKILRAVAAFHVEPKKTLRRVGLGVLEVLRSELSKVDDAPGRSEEKK